MAIVVGGKSYKTTADAAAYLEISQPTLNRLIAAGIIAEPPVVYQGTREFRIFPSDFLRKARKDLESHRKKRSKGKASKE